MKKSLNKLIKSTLTKFIREEDVNYFIDKYLELNDCFDNTYIESLKKNILESSFLAKNHLNYNFSNTLGFSVIFKKDFKDKVIEKFPFFEKYLDKIIEEPYNAFYLNPLVLSLSGKVDRHIDHSLRSYYLKIPFPERVCVLYVDIPEMSGGNLILYNNEKFLSKIKPESNKLILFKGDLKHEITTISEIDNSFEENNKKRISLVCEQYNLDKYSLSKIPDFLIRSDTSFNNFLENELHDEK
ncbi:MAG: 2OG-Fe(II) oxygenase [Candidatus Sericytochromatia bacterium]